MINSNDNIVLKRLQANNKKEQAFFKKPTGKNSAKINALLADKVPQNLQGTIKMAFAKSFNTIFEKGTLVIEKSFNRDEIELKHKVNSYALNIKPDNKRIKAFENEAFKAQSVNVLLSGAKGVGMGLLGIGLPDIPVFIGMVLKGIYEIALQYGYDYKSEEDRFFILNIITISLMEKERAMQKNEELNAFIISKTLPQNYDRQELIHEVSDVLSTELLCMKFLQGVPIVGAVGGVFDAFFTKRILDFAKIQYNKKFLLEKLNEQNIG